MPLSLPFSHLNLRKNPFGTPTAEERDELFIPRFDIGALEAHLAQPRRAVQLRGEQGRGKSTHLRFLHRSFDVPYTYIGEGERPPIPRAAVVFIDESQRLSARDLRRILRWPAAFAFATHEDHRRAFDKAGIEVLDRVIEGIDETLLTSIVSRRISFFRRSDGPVPSLTQSAFDWLIAQYADNLRAIERHLYELFQALEAPLAITPEHLQATALPGSDGARRAEILRPTH